MGVVCPVMACWTSIPEWSLGRSAHACSITCSGVAVGGHSRCRRQCRPVAVSRHKPTTRNGFLPHREALVVPVCNPNRACPTHPRNGPAVRRLPFFWDFFFLKNYLSIQDNLLWCIFYHAQSNTTNTVQNCRSFIKSWLIYLCIYWYIIILYERNNLYIKVEPWLLLSLFEVATVNE